MKHIAIGAVALIAIKVFLSVAAVLIIGGIVAFIVMSKEGEAA